MKALTILFILILLSLNIDAQSSLEGINTDTIIYVKKLGETFGYVFRTNSEITSYQRPLGECIGLSLDGRYLASTTQDAQTLKIFYFPTMELIYQQDWNQTWKPCYLVWISHDILIFDSIEAGVFADVFKFENLSLTEISPEIHEPVYPTLPDYKPDLFQNFILQNPTNPDIYLYERCLISLNDEWYCDSTDVVIYNVATQTVLKRLKGASGDYMRGYTVDFYLGGTPYISEKLVSWSPDGRYLAYFSPSLRFSIPHEGKLIVYDLLMDRYFEDVGDLYLPNINRKLQWSDNNILAIWRTGLFSDIYYGDFHGTLNLFTFLHADTETYVTVGGNILFDTWTPWVIFSPDGNTVAFIGQERVIPEQQPNFSGYGGDLIYISTVTGEYTVIDTDVTEIITWRSICDFTVSDATSLIATMQTEPYSVICLDEGEYTLTAPLPNVFGDITLIGNGASIVTAGAGRIFDVASTGGLHLKNLTVSGGDAVQGGAIYNAGVLSLDDVVLESNSADEGGAIYNIGTLTMRGGALQGNVGRVRGGGIYNAGDMDLDGVNIRDNDAPEGSGVYQG